MFSKILKDKINTTLDSEAIETLIYAAYDIVVDEGYEFENCYFLVSEALEIIDSSLKNSDLDENEGFIIPVIHEDGDDIWEPLTRSFVNFFNENFDRSFVYNEWYNPELEENYSEDLIDDDTLIEFYDQVCKSVAYNVDLNAPLSVIVDCECLEIISVIPESENTDPEGDNYVSLNIDPTKHTSYLYMSEDCQDEIYDKFGFEFDREMFYEFEIWED